ncbi:hypothetical protein ACTXN9_11510 [Corynebacterium casei]|uniref:hypothetical protein n=1 Tax=Corynebacterium casei TaxID=160386 RepID=UPI003FD27F2D
MLEEASRSWGIYGGHCFLKCGAEGRPLVKEIVKEMYLRGTATKPFIKEASGAIGKVEIFFINAFAWVSGVVQENDICELVLLDAGSAAIRLGTLEGALGSALVT